ncbi:MAG TPA: GNAT family N-acetyltransferase [Candidatus Binataceae bacterium]|nr:GNAT family N-acetyltransferase [Candidatus Binataceae bacterium]
MSTAASGVVLNAAKLIGKPDRGLRRFQQLLWSSALYRRGYPLAAALTRPFRRLELATIFRQDLTGPVELFDANIDVDIGLASAQEVERAAETLHGRVPDRRAIFRWRLEDGCICFVARVGSAIVGYTWARLRPGPDDGDMLALADHEAFDFDLYVDPKWRGHRIQTALGSRKRLFCKQQGYIAIYSKTSVMNRKSLKGMRRSPWKPTGVVLRVRGSKRGGWPILTLWGSAHPLTRLRAPDSS